MTEPALEKLLEKLNSELADISIHVERHIDILMQAPPGSREEEKAFRVAEQLTSRQQNNKQTAEAREAKRRATSCNSSRYDSVSLMLLEEPAGTIFWPELLYDIDLPGSRFKTPV